MLKKFDWQVAHKALYFVTITCVKISTYSTIKIYADASARSLISSKKVYVILCLEDIFVRCLLSDLYSADQRQGQKRCDKVCG